MAKLFALLLYVSLTTWVLAASWIAEEHPLLKRQESASDQGHPLLGQRQETEAAAERFLLKRDETTVTDDTTVSASKTTIVITSTAKPTTHATTTATPRTTTQATTAKQTTQETTAPTTTPTTQGNTPTDTSSLPDQSSDVETSTTPMTTLSPTTRRQVTTIISTITSGTVSGQVSTIVSTSTTVETPKVPVTTTPSDQAQSGSGLKPATKKTIIGVVVGVGGALLVGGLGIFVWRLRRGRVNPVDEDDLMRRDGSPLAAGQKMRNASPEESPFKATLDQYHKPPGTVNASSNF